LNGVSYPKGKHGNKDRWEESDLRSLIKRTISPRLKLHNEFHSSTKWRSGGVDETFEQ